MSEYKHGAYASIEPTMDYVSQKSAGTIPVYIGRTPVNQLVGSAEVDKPILITSYNDAVKKIGYSDDFESFELCEAVYAHFRNNIYAIGPIVVINVLDKTKHIVAEKKTADVTFSKQKGEIITSKAILDTITIEGKVVGKDYSVKYSADGLRVIINDLMGTMSGNIAVTYSEIDVNAIDNNDVIVAIEEMVPLVYQIHNIIPTILCSPKWSESIDVHNSLCNTAKLINGHWYAFVNSDLPTSAEFDSIAKVISEKEKRLYGNPTAAICWPKVKKGDRVFHLSTLTTYTMQRVDNINNNLPFETPSNKKLDISGLCLSLNEDIVYDQLEANKLNAVGIRTASFWGGQYVLWGSHTAPYVHGENMDVKDQFDCSVRMLQYIANDFQLKYGDIVDKPMKRTLVDTILNDYQAMLDSLIQQGAILSASISFNEENNPVSEIVQGDFIFDIGTTTTPPAKSITARIIYNTDGISVLYGGDN